MKTLRIAHLLPWSAIGGTEIATMRAAKAAIGFGAACRLFLPAGSDALADRARQEGLETEFYGWGEPSLRRPLPYWRANRAFASSLRAWGADILHAGETLAAFRLSLAGRLARIPVVCHVRNRQTYFSRRDQVFLRPVTHFVFVSQSTRDTFGVTPGGRTSSVLYDSLDVQAIPSAAERVEARSRIEAEFGIPSGAPLVGMVGRVDPQKDLPTFFRAVEQTLKSIPEALFLVIGALGATPEATGYYEREVRPLLSDRGIGSRVTFTGFRTDAGSLMQALDLFVLATHFEGFPLVLLEAMGRGIPVCATAVDGIPEALAGGAGLLHRHQDHAALAGHMVRLLQDRDEASALGLAGRKRVESVYSLKRYASELEALYRSLVPERTASI